MPGIQRHLAEFDYVIVGAGAAGCLLASRLTEDKGVTVCLIESGPPDWHPFIHIPAGFIKLLFDERFTWQMKTEASPFLANRQIRTIAGRVLGGGSSINGMIYSRGQAADFDSWAQRGNAGWSYADVLPYFKRGERRLGNRDTAYHGGTGELPVSDTDWQHPLIEAFLSGAAASGIPLNADYNGATQFGAGYYQRTIERGFRRNAARCFLAPATTRGTLEVWTSCRAQSLVFEGHRCSGVRFVHDKKRWEVGTVRARREVIISAGALNTPKLLQLSGIGRPYVLESLQVPVRMDLPAGENLRDHYGVRVVARTRGVTTINESSRSPRLMAEVARWALRKPSILAIPPSVAFLFCKTDPALESADVQGMFTPGSYREGHVGLLDKFPGMTLGMRQNRPLSAGYVHARSTDPFEDPKIQPNYLAEEADRRVLVSAIKIARDLLRSPPLEKYYGAEELPGNDVRSDQAILDFARRTGSSAYHVVGTARMGPASDSTSVVDPELRVHGVDCLRVVDASIMPNIVSGNTYAATLMIADKASDMIRGRQPLTPEVVSPQCASQQG